MNSINSLQKSQQHSARGLTAFCGVVAAFLVVFPTLSQAQEITTTNSGETLSRQLDIGMSGNDVSALQTFLASNASIYPEGLVTGYFGELTSMAVARFQTQNGLEAVGRVGPLTLALLTGGTVTSIGGTGGSDDMSAPILYPETVRTNANSATFVWYTNEEAFASVFYGNTWPFNLATAQVEKATSGLSTYQTVTIHGLAPNALYFYVLQSVDQSGNISKSVAKAFSTIP